jgi:EAL domain-containing protein (putative c-di-GMP-specific phosphodiesterase class I)
MAETGYARERFHEADTSEENLLLSRLKRVEANPSGIFSVHIHMSQLQANNRQTHLLKIATNSLLELEKSYEVKAFSMYNMDVILVCRNVPIDAIDSAIDMARYTFSEDPILVVDTDIREDDFEDGFSTWYDLSQSEDYSVFLTIANDLLENAQSNQKLLKSNKHNEAKDTGEPLSALNLDLINQSLQTVRIADLVHNQTCIIMSPEGPSELVFKEHSISMDRLKERIGPNVNLFSSPCLFQYLTETLDKRMLAVLGNRDFDKLPFNISINLNVSTVLSRGFQKFDQIVSKNTSKVIVEVQIQDIFADMGAFSQARDTLQERGYKIIVDGLSPLALQFFDPALLKSNFIKINWDSLYEGEVDPIRMKDLSNVIDTNGKERIILARVNTNKAIKWGMELGISRFQGFFIDALMEKIGGDKALISKEVKKKKIETTDKVNNSSNPKVKKAQPNNPIKSEPATDKTISKA